MKQQCHDSLTKRSVTIKQKTVRQRSHEAQNESTSRTKCTGFLFYNIFFQLNYFNKILIELSDSEVEGQDTHILITNERRTNIGP